MDNHGKWRPRRPRIDAGPSGRIEDQRRSFGQLRAEIESLHRRLVATEERLAALEAERERRERIVRTCSMCGRVSTRPGPDAKCPYCNNGRLEQV